MSIISTAKSYIGKVIYQFGASDIDNGFGDCSSFTQTVFSKNGYQIGRTTENQYNRGTTIPLESMQSEDLIFFKDTYDSGHTDGVSHVGIAIDTENFIHLSSSGVKISNINEPYYSEHFLKVKRITSGTNNSSTVGENEIPKDTETGGTTVENVNLDLFGNIAKVFLTTVVLIMGVLFLVQSIGIKTPIGGK